MAVIRKQFSITDATECRLWQRYMTDGYELLNLRRTVADTGIYGGHVSHLVHELIKYYYCYHR